MPYPVNEEGFIDVRELYKVVYGKLAMANDTLENMSPLEISYILEGYYEKQNEVYENITYAVYSAAVGSMQKGKFKNPYTLQREKEEKDKKIRQTRAKAKNGTLKTMSKDEEWAMLREIFNIDEQGIQH